MIPQYNPLRNCYVCFVRKAMKDNKVVKKGESYFWVKKTNYSSKEYFKNEEELNASYPNHYDLTSKQLEKILTTFKFELKENNRLELFL